MKKLKNCTAMTAVEPRLAVPCNNRGAAKTRMEPEIGMPRPTTLEESE